MISMRKVILIAAALVLSGALGYKLGKESARKVVLSEGEQAVVYSGASDGRVVISMHNSGELRVRAYSSLNPVRQPDVEFDVQSGRAHKVERLLWTSHLADRAVTRAYDDTKGLRGTIETLYKDCPPLESTEYNALLSPHADTEPRR